MIDWRITIETLPPRPWRVGGYAIDDTWSVFDANDRIICRGIMTKPTADFIAWCGNNFRTVSTATDLEHMSAEANAETIKVQDELGALLHAERDCLRMRNRSLVEALLLKSCPVDSRSTIGECRDCGCTDGLLLHLEDSGTSRITRLPHIARQFDLMVKGARSLDLGSWEDRFDEMRRAACDGTITAEQIAELIDYDYQTGQDPKAGMVTLIAAILKDALRI